MNNLIPFILLLSLITGCSTMTPARYSVSADTNSTLKQIKPKNGAELVSLSEPESYSSNCRLMGPIKAGDGLTIPEFIRNAFNDELKFADLFDSTDGVKLHGSIDRIDFSSISGLTNGWWDIQMTLNAPSGRTTTTSIHHEFPSGFDAITACNQTAQALGAAVQDLINNLVTDPSFPMLFQK